MEKFKEQLARFGVDWAVVNGKICFPCPFSNHEGKRANILIGMATDFGQCDICGKKANSTDCLVALETKAKSERSQRGETKNKRRGDSEKEAIPLKIQLLRVADILGMEFADEEWLVENLIPLPSVVALSGMSGHGKTWVTIHIAQCVANGLPIFGKFRSIAAPVLIISEEDYPKHLKKRFQTLGITEADRITYLSFAGFKADDPKQIEELKLLIKQEGFKLVIIDSLIRVHDQDENDARGMAKVSRGLRQLAKEGAAVLFTHHHRKQDNWKPNNATQSLRGSSDIEDGGGVESVEDQPELPDPDAYATEAMPPDLFERMMTDRSVRAAVCSDSHYAFFHFYLAHAVDYDTAAFQREMFKLSEDDELRKIFIVAFRGSGKSTIFTTSYPLWAIMGKQQKKFVVILIDQKLLCEIRTYSQRFTDSPNEKFLLMILGSQAKLENDNRGVNVKRGMKTRCEMGLRPGVAPVGYLNENRSDRKCYVMFDPVRAPIIKQMFERVGNDHWSGRKVYHWLKFELNFKAKSNKNMALSSIFLTLQNPFYYGVFEYPVKSGNWYTGKHEPLITKELYEKVQEHLKRDQITHGESREFAFTRLMTCGLCGSGITAAEKFKKLSTGEVACYIYYWCSRSKDKNCRSGCLREEELIKQLVEQLDKLDLNESGIKKRFEAEVARFSKFQKSFMGAGGTAKPKGVDFHDYARYVLEDGSMTERREFMGCIKSKITITKKVVAVQKEEKSEV